MQTQASQQWLGGRRLRRFLRRRGFALIVTLTLMTLLAALALGFLGLSTIALRTSSADGARYEARANARLALMLAIGELQRTAGSDKAVTATSGIVSETPGKPNLTGVWQSWNYDTAGGSAPNYTTEKNNRFQGWLVSDADPDAARNPNYSGSGFVGETIELVGEGALGAGAPPSDRVTAGRVPVKRNDTVTGAYAWHVADEAVKARIGTYRNPSLGTTLAQKRALLAGHRPDVSVVKSRDGATLDFLPNDDSQSSFEKATEAAGKLVSISQTDLFAAAPRTGSKFRNAVTPYSLGLLTDARNGGLKKDLSSLFEAASLPPEYGGKKLYQSTKVLSTPVASDPNWSALYDYYRIYKSIKNPETQPTFSAAPTEDIDATATKTAPTTFYPAPVIAKLDILFSLVLRDTHSNWVNDVPAAAPADPQRKYLMHLLYTPLITLHNPYNVALEFTKMRVIIRNPPVAFNFWVNEKMQNSTMVTLGEMYSSNPGEKSLVFDVGNWQSATESTPGKTVVMKPGQTLVCSPYLDPTQLFAGNASAGIFFDYQNNLTGIDKNGNLITAKIPKAKPGFTGKSVGFDIDFLTPKDVGGANSSDNGLGILGMREDAAFRCEFAMQQPKAGMTSQFQISATITSNGVEKKYGGIVFDYGTDTTLKKHFPPPNLRFPQSGSWPASEFRASNSIPLVAQVKARTIGMLSVCARTSNGGVYETGSRSASAGALNSLVDGRVAGKPFLFANPASALEVVDLKNDVLGNAARELNFQALKGEVDDLFSIDSTNRTNTLSANTTQNGIKSGSYLELPTGPLQAIADFRRSNALTTPFPPSFVQPVGNSWASPLLATNSVNQPPAGGSAPLLDQSYLANHALYDGFYFSTVAPDGANADGGKVLRDFLSGGRFLPNQSFQPWMPDGETASSLASRLYSGTGPSASAHTEMAGYQMIKGPFNVNSTNVEAWKAMLSSMSRSEITTFWAKTGVLQSRKANEVPVPSMTLPVAGSTKESFDAIKMDSQRANEWNGYRELTPGNIQTLAEEIVRQVRERGPFLSLSEFVNRRIGPDSELTRVGALQAAINQSGVNNDMYQAPDYIPVSLTDVTNPVLYNYKTPQAAVGNPAEGAPGWLSQGDLMKLLEPAATVRADTFVIRVCGEAVDGKGRITARAYGEAVVQRVPEFVDPSDKPSVNVNQGTAGAAANKIFGRRMKVVSFRWLSNSEI